MAGINLGIDDDKSNEGQQQENRADDPIARYLDATVGEEGDETAEDTETQSGDEKQSEGNKEQSATGKDSNSNNKNSDGKQKSDEKGKKDEGQAGAANGDLTLQDGTVVKGGAERRHYERARLAEQQLSMRTNELNQSNQARERLQNELNTLKSSVQSLHGADPAHVSTGLKLVRDLQRDPAGTLKTLLTEATAAGYPIESIAGGIDVNAIRQQIEQQYAPVINAARQQQEQQEQHQRIDQEVQQFYTNFPDARVHDEVIAAVMQKNPQLSMSEAYYQLKLAAIDRGLDWSKPLPPQIQQSGSEQQQQQSQQQQQKPMPNGRGPANEAQATKADKIAVAHESTDMGSIVKEAMREAGMKI